MGEQKYTRQEVDAIVARALEREREDHLGHQELVALGREVGLASESIERAAAEVLEERRQREGLSALRARQWRSFIAHLIPFLVVSTMLVVLNALTTSFAWAIFLILGWGIGIAFQLFALIFPDRERLLRRLERESRRQRKRELKARAHHVRGVELDTATPGGPAERVDPNGR